MASVGPLHNGELTMNEFERLNREFHTTIVMVTHDRTFAARASRQIVLKDGYIEADEHQRTMGHPRDP